jgi:hypothetical protein
MIQLGVKDMNLATVALSWGIDRRREGYFKFVL